MQGKIHIVVGMKRAGKTHYSKRLIARAKRVLVFDPYGEYPDLQIAKSMREMNEINRCRVVGMTFKNFKKAIPYMRNKLIIGEDATIGIKANIQDDETLEALTATRHHNLYLVLLFHSLMKVPPYCIESGDFLTVHKTKDDYYKVVRKYEGYCPEAIKLFLLAKKSDNPHFYKTISI